jgi:hypothetical protein
MNSEYANQTEDRQDINTDMHIEVTQQKLNLFE